MNKRPPLKKSMGKVKWMLIASDSGKSGNLCKQLEMFCLKGHLPSHLTWPAEGISCTPCSCFSWVSCAAHLGSKTFELSLG